MIKNIRFIHGGTDKTWNGPINKLLCCVKIEFLTHDFNKVWGKIWKLKKINF